MTMKVKTLSFHAIAYRLTMKLCSDESSLERQHIEYLQQTFQQKQQQVWPLDLGHVYGPYRVGHTAVQGPLAGLLWATPCMAHDGPHRLSLGPTWPNSALLFIDPLIRQRMNAVWDNLGICPKTGPDPTDDSRMSTYKYWFARPAGHHARSHPDLPLSMHCMQRLLVFRMHPYGLRLAGRLPQAALGHCQGSSGWWLHVPRLDKLCPLCQQGVLGDDKHLVFECSAVQGLRVSSTSMRSYFN